MADAVLRILISHSSAMVRRTGAGSGGEVAGGDADAATAAYNESGRRTPPYVFSLTELFEDPC